MFQSFCGPSLGIKVHNYDVSMYVNKKEIFTLKNFTFIFRVLALHYLALCVLLCRVFKIVLHDFGTKL
jgi:hypothetical protein